MPLPSLKRLSFTPPTRKVVLMPDVLFFVRVVPVAEASTEAEVTSAVELALESLSPFPLSQLYYGHHWKPGAKHALVFAAYRKRFSTEHSENWGDADLVLPAFTALLGVTVQPGTVIMINTADGITGLHWVDPTDVPARVVMQPWLLDTSDEAREKARDEIVRGFGANQAVVYLNDLPLLDADASETDFVFRAGELASTLTREQADALDVRDKDELAARRRARARDLVLWRTFAGSAIALALCAALEIFLIGGHVWQNRRLATVDQQRPIVDSIMTAQSLATRIEELSTKRLRPFEMIYAVNEKRPPSVVFLRTTTNGLYTLEIDANTNVPSDLVSYLSVLNALPTLAKPVEVQHQQSRDGVSSFTLVLTFKPDAFTTTIAKS